MWSQTKVTRAIKLKMETIVTLKKKYLLLKIQLKQFHLTIQVKKNKMFHKDLVAKLTPPQTLLSRQPTLLTPLLLLSRLTLAT